MAHDPCQRRSPPARLFSRGAVPEWGHPRRLGRTHLPPGPPHRRRGARRSIAFPGQPPSFRAAHDPGTTPRRGRPAGPPRPRHARAARRDRAHRAGGRRGLPHGPAPLPAPGVLRRVRGAARLPVRGRPALHRLAHVRALRPLLREAVRGGDEPARPHPHRRERVDGVELRPLRAPHEAVVRQAPGRLPGAHPPASGGLGRDGGLPRPDRGARAGARGAAPVERAGAPPDPPEGARRHVARRPRFAISRSACAGAGSSCSSPTSWWPPRRRAPR